MFSLGVFMLWLGYAFVYTAIANIRNGYQGPRLSESLGLRLMIAPPSAEVHGWGRRAGAPTG